MAHSDLVQSLLRGLDLLRLVAAAPMGLRLLDLAESSGLKKTTVHNLVRTLRARGFLEKDGTGRFRLGPAVQELSSQVQRSIFLQRAAELLQDLHRQFPLAVLTFSEITSTAVVCRLRMSPDRPGEVQRPASQFFAPYSSATAICLQATGGNAPEFERLFSFAEFGQARWGTWEDFRASKAEVINQGYYHQLDSAHGSLTLALAIPENYALGCRIDADQSWEQTGILRAARKFRQSLLST